MKALNLFRALLPAYHGLVPGALTGMLALLTTAPATAAPTTHAPKLPARLLVCSLGHATNFDPAKQQTLDDITYDVYHRLSLFLPKIRQRTSEPPDATEVAEKVDPKTRVIEDPDGIFAEAAGPFERVVDLWPERVELTRQTPTGMYKTFLVSDYDPANGTARMFLGTASDITTYDLKRIYMGECKVTLNPPKRPKAH
jgi:hypothetical protein